MERQICENIATNHQGELDSLRDLSARVGSDPLLVQGSNGNTSIKLDDVLWIKISGKRLEHATKEEIHIPLPLALIRDCIENEMEIPPSLATVECLRPSIEMPTHAVIPHRVVVHVHSINSIAWGIRLDGPHQLETALRGLNWQWIPYAPSGIPLALEVQKAVSENPRTDVFILANHGLVVCGNSCQTADALLRTVECRLALRPREYPKADHAILVDIAKISGWQIPDVEDLQALATDPVSCAIVSGGILYPCQAFFLGRAMPLLSKATLRSAVCALSNGSQTAPFIAIEGAGVMVREQISCAERETLIGLVQVVQRAANPKQIRYLNEREITDVLKAGRY